MKELVCVRCDYHWNSRVEEPKECPRCKHRGWKGLPQKAVAIKEALAKGDMKALAVAAGVPVDPEPEACAKCGVMGVRLVSFKGELVCQEDWDKLVAEDQ